MRVSLLVAAFLMAAAPVFAQNMYTSSPGAAIPDNDPIGITDQVTVPASDTGTATDVDVEVNITHTWVGDLFIEMRHPLGPVVVLMDRPGVPASTFGCSEDNVAATFDDEGTDGPVEVMCGAGPPGIFGTPVPEQALSAFDAPAVGTWEIFVSDNAGGDIGTLDSWTVIIDGIVPVELTSFEYVLNGTDVNLSWTTASETNNAGFEVQVSDGTGWTALGFVEGSGTTTEAQTYSFTAAGMDVGTHVFRLKQIDFDGAFEYSGELEVEVETPGSHVLSAAYPNPFNPSSQFTLAVGQEQTVAVELYNTLGQRIAVLFDGTVEANQSRAFTIDGAGLPSGLYVVRVTGETFADALRVTLLK